MVNGLELPEGDADIDTELSDSDDYLPEVCLHDSMSFAMATIHNQTSFMDFDALILWHTKTLTYHSSFFTTILLE